VLGPKPINIAYAQPSRRPADGRYGENPNRLFKHMQFQVILKPPPANVQELYLESLKGIGIDLRKHDIKFEEDNWESPTLGAWGIGWQVMLDGLEITQFTYFQQCGGIDLDPISAELTYGLERIGAFLQDVDSIYDITWVIGPDGRQVKYGEIRLQDELQFSVYNFERADVGKAWEHLRLYEAECQALLDDYAAQFAERDAKHSGKKDKNKSASGDPGEERKANSEERVSGEERLTKRRRFPVLGAFDLCLKCSHLFNILDARGAISVTERVGVIARIRALAVGVAKAYVDQQQADELSTESESRVEELAASG
jgi:glycyl-tRNA synthetase alpha chain